jgi:hypothetical protein
MTVYIEISSGSGQLDLGSGTTASVRSVQLKPTHPTYRSAVHMLVHDDLASQS